MVEYLILSMFVVISALPVILLGSLPVVMAWGIVDLVRSW